MHAPTLIGRKRDGGTLTDAEIRALVAGYVDGSVPDYQMSAFAMAVCTRGMTNVETVSLTRAMMESGDRYAHSAGFPVVDKHSTGGIGDKTSLVLAPLVACFACRVPMVSGRGLGITGGTLDKLESVPGFRVGLSMEEAVAQLARIGVFMMGQTERFCPADRKLYALRDVTGTVPSIPLITASIMSKKLCESLDRLVLDVKYGSGAFMKTRAEAEVLARGMIAVGQGMGVETTALLHPMDEPTGRAVGNALEVAEAVDCLKGGGPEDLRKITLDLAEVIAGVPRAELEAALDDGRAWGKFRSLVSAQAGDADALEHLREIHRAPVVREILAEEDGIVTKVDAGLLGQAALLLGAGRAKADDSIDFRVGFDRIVKTGEQRGKGDVLFRIHAASEDGAENARAMLAAAILV